MLFKTIDNKYVEIKKMDFDNDKLYYEKIMKTKGWKRRKEDEKTKEDVIEEIFRKLA